VVRAVGRWMEMGGQHSKRETNRVIIIEYIS
jgi:hypothetical protein